MRKLNRSSRLWITGLLSISMLFASGIGLAGDVDVDDEGRKFDSRQRLERTVLLQDRQDQADAREALEEAQALLERAIAAGAPQETIDRIQAEVDRREATVESGREEIQRVLQLVADLSDEQVFAYNRALNNTLHNGLVYDLDSETLKRALGADLDRRQINAVTKALEQEARFLQKAEYYRGLAESTGDESYLRQAARAEAKAESEREKFLARVQREPVAEPTGECSKEERRALRAQARSLGKDEAREHAHKMAKEHALALAKNVAAGELRSGQRDRAGSEAAKEAKHAANEAKQNRGRALGHEKNKHGG